MEDRNDGTIFINGEPHVFVMKDVHLTPEQTARQIEFYRKLLQPIDVKPVEAQIIYGRYPGANYTFWTRVKDWFRK